MPFANCNREGGDTFAYDAENKLVQYQGGATQTGGADYFYDGEGWRVKKARPSEALIFVYNVGGQLVAEYTTSTPESNGTSYLTSDTLGTPRALTKADGSIRARHDYLPFGEELYAGVGSRTTDQEYDQGSAPTDTTRQKFTSKERDVVSGLDYFLARYYSSAQGRFTSPDSFAGSALNPQTLNLYAYVQNDPLNYTDPTGHFANRVSYEPARCLLLGGMGCNGEPMLQAQDGQEGPPPPQPPPLVLPPLSLEPDPGIDKKVLDRLDDLFFQRFELQMYIKLSPIGDLVNNYIFGTDDNGKVTVDLGLTDWRAAIAALANDKERFVNAGLGHAHVEELGESSAKDVADFRSYTEGENRLGPKSLQINIGKNRGRARADLDRTNPKQDLAGGVVHGVERAYNWFKRQVKKR